MTAIFNFLNAAGRILGNDPYATDEETQAEIESEARANVAAEEARLDAPYQPGYAERAGQLFTGFGRAFGPLDETEEEYEGRYAPSSREVRHEATRQARKEARESAARREDEEREHLEREREQARIRQLAQLSSILGTGLVLWGDIEAAYGKQAVHVLDELDAAGDSIALEGIRWGEASAFLKKALGLPRATCFHITNKTRHSALTEEKKHDLLAILAVPAMSLEQDLVGLEARSQHVPTLRELKVFQAQVNRAIRAYEDNIVEVEHVLGFVPSRRNAGRRVSSSAQL